MRHEQLLFEMASGWDFETRLKRNSVTMRDYFVQLMRERYSKSEIGEAIGKHRTSIYASLQRFNTFSANEKAYRERFEEIKRRFLGIEIAETY